jgi:hypothetical protein
LVGDKGAGLPTSLTNGFVGFKVEKSWLNNSTANESTIILQWYDNGWHPLYTEKIGEDENYVFYEAEVSAYSSFAITENTGVQKEDKKYLSVAEKLQQTLKTLTGEGNEVKISSVKKGESKIENPMGLGKTIIAISFPLFMAIAGYCILKKKI